MRPVPRETMNYPPIEEELKTAFFGVFAITLKPQYILKRRDKRLMVALPNPHSPRHTRIVIGLHSHSEQLHPNHLELEIIPDEIQVEIPYEAIQDYKRIGDLP